MQLQGTVPQNCQCCQNSKGGTQGCAAPISSHTVFGGWFDSASAGCGVNLSHGWFWFISVFWMGFLFLEYIWKHEKNMRLIKHLLSSAQTYLNIAGTCCTPTMNNWNMDGDGWGTCTHVLVGLSMAALSSAPTVLLNKSSLPAWLSLAVPGPQQPLSTEFLPSI